MIEELSYFDLKNILITADGKGKDIKEDALLELLKRARDDGVEGERESDWK